MPVCGETHVCAVLSAGWRQHVALPLRAMTALASLHCKSPKGRCAGGSLISGFLAQCSMASWMHALMALLDTQHGSVSAAHGLVQQLSRAAMGVMACMYTACHSKYCVQVCSHVHVHGHVHPQITCFGGKHGMYVCVQSQCLHVLRDVCVCCRNATPCAFASFCSDAFGINCPPSTFQSNDTICQ